MFNKHDLIAGKSFILPCYVNRLFYVLVHIFKFHTHTHKKSLTVEGLPGWGDHIHTRPGSLRSGLPKPAGFRTENLTNMGGTRIIQGY